MAPPNTNAVNIGRGGRRTAGRASGAACLRCRQKKKRCDQRLPKCRLCEVAGVECVGYDAINRKQIPRSYVRGLEERIAHLEGNLQPADKEARREIPAEPSNPPIHNDFSRAWPGEADRQSSHSAAAGSTVDEVQSLTQHTSESDRSFSKVFLAELMGSSIKPRLPRQMPTGSNVSEVSLSAHFVNSLDDGPISLPPKPVAQRLSKAFFQCSSLGMPLLHEPTFEKTLEAVYKLPRTINTAKTHTSNESRIAVFFVLEVLAVGLLSMHKLDPTRVPTWIADRYHEAATNALSEAGLPHNLEGVQALLLIAIYSYHHPNQWAVWKTAGAAIRFAVELGLHQDHPTADLDFLTLDTMRRTFWVAYALERNISISLTIPTNVSDGAISAKFPSEVEDSLITSEGSPLADTPISGCKAVSLHLFRYRQIQSEMQRVLHEKPPPPYTPINLEAWQRGTEERIHTWYRNKPRHSSMSEFENGIVDTFDVTYETALFYLFRPSPNIPEPTGPQLAKMASSAAKMITLYRRFFCSRQLTIYWQAMENLYSAGTCLMFGYVQSQEVQGFLSYSDLESLVRICSSVLWGMAERFPSFQGRRDAFDKIASKTLADLNSDSKPLESVKHGYGTRGLQLRPSSPDGIAGEPLRLPSTQFVGDILAPPNPPITTLMGMDEAGMHGALNSFTFQDFDYMSAGWETSSGNDGLFTPICIL